MWSTLPHDHQIDHFNYIAYARFREPPTPAHVERLVRLVVQTYDRQFSVAIHAKLAPETLLHMDALLRITIQPNYEAASDDDGTLVRLAFPELSLISARSVLYQLIRILS